MTFDARGKVSVFRFHATEFSGGAASSFSCGCCGRALAGQVPRSQFPLLGGPRPECAVACHASRRCMPRRLGCFSVSDGGSATALNLNSFLFNSRRVFGHYAHVTFGAFDFMGQPCAVTSRAIDSRSSRPMASLRITTASSSSTKRARACLADASAATSTQHSNFRARFQLSQLTFERQQSRALFERASITGADKLSAGYPVAVQRYKTSPVASDFVIASSRLAARRAFIFAGQRALQTPRPARAAHPADQKFSGSQISPRRQKKSTRPDALQLCRPAH